MKKVQFAESEILNMPLHDVIAMAINRTCWAVKNDYLVSDLRLSNSFSGIPILEFILEKQNKNGKGDAQ